MTIPFFGIPNDWYSYTGVSIIFVSVTAHFIICRADLSPLAGIGWGSLTPNISPQVNKKIKIVLDRTKCLTITKMLSFSNCNGPNYGPNYGPNHTPNYGPNYGSNCSQITIQITVQMLVQMLVQFLVIVPCGKFHRIWGAPPGTFSSEKYDAPEEVGGDRKRFDSPIRKWGLI